MATASAHPGDGSHASFFIRRCFHRAHSSFIVLPSFSFLPARKYRHMARFIPILTLTAYPFSTDSLTAFPASFSAVTVVFYQMQRSAVALDTAA